MTFRLLAYRFRFRALDRIVFLPGQAGNQVRGAFGTIFRRIACVPECPGARVCELRASCAYARVFEPRAAAGEPGPSGLVDWPRPFVFRASHLDGREVAAGDTFHFDVHLFDCKEPPVAYFVLAFSALAREGLGPGRGRAELAEVWQLDARRAEAERIFDGATPSEVAQWGRLPACGGLPDRPPKATTADDFLRDSCPTSGRPTFLQGKAKRIELDLRPSPKPVERLVVRFVTPTELKSGKDIVRRPEFGILFGRLRDRLSTLRSLYGAGPLEIDFRAMGERAAAVRLERCEVEWQGTKRRSSKTGQIHPLEGFVGEAEYVGDLGEFLPYLQAGAWVGVGRQTVWGKGEIHPALH